MKAKIIIIGLNILMILGCSVYAQDGTEQAKEIENIDNFFDNVKKEDKSVVIPPGLPLGIPGLEIDEETRMEFNRSMQEFYAYRSSGYQHRRQVFEWQLFSSKIIFYVVICLVTIGGGASHRLFFTTDRAADRQRRS